MGEEIKRVVPTSVEQVKELYQAGNCALDLKSCDVKLKADIIRYALTQDNVTDPLMLLNILNLVKVYNTLDDSYFEAPDIYVSSVEELLDLKLDLNKDLKAFARQLSIYFLSLIKSYNKFAYTPADEHYELPKTYESIILATDMLTLAGIFAKVTNISTDELLYIDNAYIYMTSLILKGADCADFVNEFYSKKGEQ